MKVQNTNQEPILFDQSTNAEQSIDFYSFNLSYTTSSDGSIEAGMNDTIIVPSQIFTNSYFYQHEIVEGKGATNWPNLTFYSDDENAENTDPRLYLYEFSELS